MAWVRTVGGVSELVVASDSRLRGGYAWDAAPKIMPLPRNDCFVAFAGSTDLAYPIMVQMTNAVGSWTKGMNRLQPLEKVKGHLLKVINRMLDELDEGGLVGVPKKSDALFLFGGFSWHEQTFRLWTLHFDNDISRFTFRPMSWWQGGHKDKLFGVVGDKTHEAKRLLRAQLQEVNKLDSGGFDMEPLQVLLRMIDDSSFPTIGGEPQVVKVYRSLNVVPMVVERDGTRSLLGRPLLDYEEVDRFPTLVV